MTTGEFMQKTNLGRKTAMWLYDNVFHTNTRNQGEHRSFSEENINWVLGRQYEQFSKTHNIKLMEETDDPYYIEDNGSIWDYRRNFFEKRKCYTVSGYLYVGLWSNGSSKNYRVHRLVAKYFVSNPNNYEQVNHIDGNKLNNHYTNLEWCTASHNTKHAFDLKLAKNDKGIVDSQSQPIAIFDADDNFIAMFGSVRLAAKYLNISIDSLLYCVKRPWHMHRKKQIYVRYMKQSDQKCNDYPEIVSYETIGVGLDDEKL